MKKIIYHVKGYTHISNSATDQVEQKEILAEIESDYTEANLETALRDAYNGEYEIYDDGKPEAELTDSERIAELEEALDMLLSGVTE